ncbi:MAG TPA: isoprenoid biosynthesis glyoxalase ElbB [Bacteroidales bacterium]|nr:isoprenoid biosynthesis glyoxalase ElbB [Bacteroidales bacterium]
MKFAIILSGCGVYDGAEIHESTMTMLAVSRNGGSYTIFAPDVKQHHVVNHLTGKEMDESRNVLVEAARIARGNIQSLDKYDINDFDALILPGGFGVAKNLCTYAFDGPDCKVDKIVEKVIRDTHAAGKPIGALCISPVLIVKILGDVDVTIGEDETTASHIKALGGVHIPTGNREIVIDNKNRIVTNPCYMLDASIVDIAEGAENLVKALMDMK